MVNLKQMLAEFVAFRREVVTRRTKYTSPAPARPHPRWPAQAVDALDLVIAIIRAADSPTPPATP